MSFARLLMITYFLQDFQNTNTTPMRLQRTFDIASSNPRKRHEATYLPQSNIVSKLPKATTSNQSQSNKQIRSSSP